MTIETELKFVIKPEAYIDMAEWLKPFSAIYTPARMLSNCYFETEDNQLRQWDMGLRIRGENGQYEMTLKTSGTTIGGLHQRPEYNLPLSQPELDLSLFPNSIWPASTDLHHLQQRLAAVFNTDFQRQTWLVTVGESEIEVALDQGSLQAAGKQQPLYELELELKRGQQDDIFTLARHLIEKGEAVCRLGYLSKAARGYALIKEGSAATIRPLITPTIVAKSRCEDGLRQILSYLLSEWQYHESLCLASQGDVQQEISRYIKNISQVLLLFSGLIPRKASHQLRHDLQLLPSLISQSVTADYLYQPQYVATQLALTHWIVSKQWMFCLNDKQRSKMDGSYKRWYDQMASRLLAEIKKITSQYIANLNDNTLLQVLEQKLEILRVISGCYPQPLVISWFRRWQLVMVHSASCQRSQALAAMKEALKQPPFWRASYQDKDNSKL